ncbi:MAG: hypothetical protein JSU98_02515 [Gemmatimonadales bacterium]|jgi:hypothetical protein|nr:MAG: hypothetical protein JSU98_02515 [Gemmatimonadales bacterium]
MTLTVPAYLRALGAIPIAARTRGEPSNGFRTRIPGASALRPPRAGLPL